MRTDTGLTFYNYGELPHQQVQHAQQTDFRGKHYIETYTGADTPPMPSDFESEQEE